MKQCICLICYKPKKEMLTFLETFTHYDIYVAVDDNTELYEDYKNIHFIQLTKEECRSHYYKRETGFYLFKKKDVTAWAKALYYFTFKKSYDHVWFLEEDVFFYNEKTIQKIDQQYSGDLLSAPFSETTNGKDWLWKYIKVNAPLPYYHCMCCAVRLSKKMLHVIKEYAEKNKTLFFLEAMLPTLCMKHNLIYHSPEELATIVFRHNHKNMNKNALYHPVKTIKNHPIYRKKLTKKV